MLNICLDARMLGSFGIGTYLRNIIPRLKGVSLKLIVHPQAQEKWLQYYDLILCSAPIYSLEEQLKLPFLIPKCDVFWSPHYNIPLFPIKAHKRWVTIHDVCHLVFNKHLSFSQKTYAKLLIARAVKQSDRIMTDSNFSRGEIVKYTGIDSKKISVIYCGVEKELEVKEYANLPEMFFVYFDSAKPHKNIAGLLKAFARVDCPLVKINGNIAKEELNFILKKAQGLVFPSLYEGFGLPPLEAMAVGCPVIVSNRASLPEVCGKAAYYVDPENEEEITKAAVTLLENQQLREDLIKKGYQQASSFSWDTAAEKILEGCYR